MSEVKALELSNGVLVLCSRNGVEIFPSYRGTGTPPIPIPDADLVSLAKWLDER